MTDEWAGIRFRDITTLLQDVRGFKCVIDALVETFKGRDIDLIAGEAGWSLCPGSTGFPQESSREDFFWLRRWRSRWESL